MARGPSLSVRRTAFLTAAAGAGTVGAWRSRATRRSGKRLARRRRSGKTVTEFCRQEGVSKPTFYAWRKRLEEGDPPAMEFVEVTRGPRRQVTARRGLGWVRLRKLVQGAAAVYEAGTTISTCAILHWGSQSSPLG